MLPIGLSQIPTSTISKSAERPFSAICWINVSKILLEIVVPHFCRSTRQKLIPLFTRFYKKSEIVETIPGLRE